MSSCAAVIIFQTVLTSLGRRTPRPYIYTAHVTRTSHVNLTYVHRHVHSFVPIKIGFTHDKVHDTLVIYVLKVILNVHTCVH